MMLFLFTCLCAALIAGTVVLLKKNNERRLQQIAEHEQHLPALDIDLDSLPTEIDDDEEADTAVANTVEIQQEMPLQVPETVNWKELVRSYRDNGHFEQAIAAAETAWPQWQYYEQVAITIRAAVRDSKKSAPEMTGTWLERLYRTAAEASLLHDRAQNASSRPIITRTELGTIPLPYSEIGVDMLRLLTKTDRKQMQDLWGTPAHHQSASAYIQHQNQA